MGEEQTTRPDDTIIRKVLDLAPMAMAIVGFDGTIEYINKKAVETFGYPHSEIPNMDRWWAQAYPDPAYRDQVMKDWMGRVMAAAEKKSEIQGNQYLVTCKGGDKKHCYIFGVIAADKVFVMFEDVTGRVNTERTLRENEASLRRIIENIPVPMVILGPDGRVEHLNRKFIQTLGYTTDDLRTYEDWVRLGGIDDEHRRESTERWFAAMGQANGKKREIDAGQFKARCKDGSIRTFYVKAVTVESKMLVMFDDITERLGAELALKESERMLHRILEQAPVAMSVQDLDARVEFINRKFTSLFGYLPEDAAKREYFIANFFPDDESRDVTFATWRKWVETSLATGGEMPGGEFQIRRKDGAVRTAFINGITTPDRKVISVFDDITDRKAAARALLENEKALRRILEQSPVCIAIHDMGGNIEFINRKFIHTFGYSLQDMPTLTRWTELAYPDANYRRELTALWAGWMENSIRTGAEMPGGEFRVVCKDGSVKTAFITGVVTADRKVVSLLDDITRRVETERALRESESRYRALVETTRTGYVIINSEGRVLDANTEYVRLTGRKDLKDILGRTVAEWTAESHKPKNAAAVEQCVRDGYIFNLEVDYAGPDGAVIPVEISATVMTKDGAPQILSLCRDISARRRTEDEIRNLNQSLERRVEERTAELSRVNEQLTALIAQRVEAEKAKDKLQEQLLQSQKLEAVGRLAGGIAHDFNNILVSISGYAEILRDTMPAGAPARTDLGEILLETERGAALTRQLLTFSSKQQPRLEKVDINAVAAGSEKMLRRLIGANMHLEPKLAQDLYPVTADPTQLSQVIINLVINARDAMPEGGRIGLETRNVELGADAAGMRLAPAPGSYAELAVSDTGTGMGPETLSHLFEPFYTTKKPGQGTGLGLSTVYGIVSRAKGGIAVESTEGKGTTFRIYLPKTS